MNLVSKQEVLKNGTYDNYMRYKRYQYDVINSDSGITEQALQRSIELEQQFSDEEFTECKRIYGNAHKRTQRIRRRVREWFDIGNVYFITLTFSDSALERTSDKYRRNEVTRFLQSLDCVYCANLDFGDLHNREHYHAIICTKDLIKGPVIKYEKVTKKGVKSYYTIDALELKPWQERFGYTFCQECMLDESDQMRLTRYLAKLTNHSIKESAASPRLIYCRKYPAWFTSKIHERRKQSYERLKSNLSGSLHKGNDESGNQGKEN